MTSKQSVYKNKEPTNIGSLFFLQPFYFFRLAAYNAGNPIIIFLFLEENVPSCTMVRFLKNISFGKIIKLNAGQMDELFTSQ